MTANNHIRAFDRVAEAAGICGIELDYDDIVCCVQGDEPMMRPDMIDCLVAPFREGLEVEGPGSSPRGEISRHCPG